MVHEQDDTRVNHSQTQSHHAHDETKMVAVPECMPRHLGSGRLEGKVALITGGDSGIGRAVAVLFAREGADIAIHHKQEQQDAQETARLIEAEGRKALLLHGDLAQRDTARRAVRETLEVFGRVNILVNNAPDQRPQDQIEDTSGEPLGSTFAANIFAQVYLVQEALPQMQPGDNIINIASMTAFRRSKELIDYAATKGAILSFTRALSASVADRGIRVNAIAPGSIWTSLFPAPLDAERVARHGAASPMGRPGQPNEVAPSALFLACDDASYITGQTLHPDGGELLADEQPLRSKAP